MIARASPKPMNLKTKLAGLLPTIILPTATGLQLIKMLTGAVDGVSAISWLLFGFANLGTYFFTEKLGSPQAIIAFLLTAILDFIIVGFALLA